MMVETKKLVNIPLDYLVCPLTKKPLRCEGNELISPDGYRYRFVDDQYWSFIPPIDETNNPQWKMWQELQKNGEVSYRNDPDNNLGINKRDDHIAFGEFCSFRGLVLDIGSGPQRMPTHFQYCRHNDATFFGIDIMAGEQPRDYLFVQGFGEYLPFRNSLFDQALFVTSLDHFIEPIQVLIEARRVLRPKGEICIWIGEKDAHAPKPKVSPEWYKNLPIPEGAEDPFHYRRFSFDEFKEYATKAGLQIAEEKITPVDPYRRNGFYRLVKAESI